MKRLLSFIPILFLLSACGTLKLDPNGVYKGDKFLYEADKAVDSAYEIVHKLVKWEYNNREALRAYPEILKITNKIRAEAPEVISTAVALIDIYELEKSQENKDKVAHSLSVLKQLTTLASSFIDKPLKK